MLHIMKKTAFLFAVMLAVVIGGALIPKQEAAAATSWSEWSGWSRTDPGSSANRQRESRYIQPTHKTQWLYYRWKAPGVWFFGPTNGTWKGLHTSEYQESGWRDSPINYAGIDPDCGWEFYGDYWNDPWYFHSTRQVQTGGGYNEYRYRDLIVNKDAPSLKFASPAVTKTYGDDDFTNVLSQVTDGSVTFFSSDITVATVNQSTGQVTIAGAGSCTISANAAEGQAYSAGSASYLLSVSKKNPTLSFAADSYTGRFGDISYMNELTAITDGEIEFESTDEQVAFVGISGVVVFNGEGECTIIARAGEGANYKSGIASFSLIVKPSTDYTWKKSGDTAIITGYTGEDQHIVIPAVLSEEDPVTGRAHQYIVSEIAEKAFYKNDRLISVRIQPDSVTSIGASAFAYCNSLTSVTLPTTLRKIGDQAFEYCAELDGLTLNNSAVDSIGERAFYMCESLTTLNLANTIVTFGDEAFSHCVGLKQLNILNCIATFGDKVFSHCESLHSLSLPNSVQTYGTNAFEYCTSLTSVALPNGVSSFGDGTFQYCTALVTVDIPNGVSSVGARAFKFCTSLRTVNIPNTVMSLGEEAYYHCDSLQNVTVPESVEAIEPNAFAECPDLSVSCYTGSTAHTYAKSNSIKYRLIDQEAQEPAPPSVTPAASAQASPSNTKLPQASPSDAGRLKRGNARAPAIQTQPRSKKIKKNRPLTLKVRASASGKISYQWYKSKTKKGKGKKIRGATKKNYKAPAKKKGTMYYYCVITNTDRNAAGKKSAKKITKRARVVVKMK